ncbi:hypothetical protein, partial [Mesorhizobium sp. M1E.F.Ca.ET.063.01.1.1]|uniref:hypothetical protein n=1 Tax=Mesorhizobium sp. M1E.F.Ca.ET.063.01.1.1 TaxID=2496750 RepID=UPI001AEC941A
MRIALIADAELASWLESAQAFSRQFGCWSAGSKIFKRQPNLFGTNPQDMRLLRFGRLAAEPGGKQWIAYISLPQCGSRVGRDTPWRK